MLSARVTRRRTSAARLRRAAICSKARAKRSMAWPAASSSSPTSLSRVASLPGVRRLLTFAQAVVERVDQLATALGRVQQVVLQVGVALHHPDVAQHLIEHAGGAAGLALGAQQAEHLPGALAQQALDDLAVGEGGVVIGDLAQAGLAVGVAVGDLCGHVGQLGGCVHEGAGRERPFLARFLNENATEPGRRKPPRHCGEGWFSRLRRDVNAPHPPLPGKRAFRTPLWIVSCMGCFAILMHMPTPNTPLDPWPYPCWIAHRGAGSLAPENTLVAFRLGAEHGFGMFECDVKLSADGEPFLLHDSELERTTNGQGLGG